MAANHPSELRALARLLAGRHVVALTGAGCSTESGIPDYRGPESKPRTVGPMQYREFVGQDAARARYWARSVIGWPRIRDARPNAGHRALARLEDAGVIAGIITQNVDGLHHAAGSRRVIELHGSLARVLCLGCGSEVSRSVLQERLLALNPGFPRPAEPGMRNGDGRIAPDGDAELSASAMERFCVPGCRTCGGVLKPDVVFFGENVPRPRVAEAWRLYETADVLLIAGTSLTVYSGRRFSDRARAEGRTIAIINMGPTRADEAAAIKLEGRLGTALPDVASLLLTASLRDAPLRPARRAPIP